MTDWISVNDRLPENNRRVLIFEGNHVLSGRYQMYISSGKTLHRWVYYSSIQPNKVTHWMDLPDHPA